MTTECPGSYLVFPPRAWNRYDNRCASSTTNPFAATKQKYVPFVNRIVNPDDYLYQQAVLQKGNILQYRNNSSNLTKNQRYAQIAKGKWTNRTTTWASQSETVSIPNTKSLRRVNYTSFNITNGQTNSTEAVTCPTTPSNPVFSTLPERSTEIPIDVPILPPPIENPVFSSPIIPVITEPAPVKSVVIEDGGSLVCNISENPCTGEIYSVTQSKDCYPTSVSDVPGPEILLCWSDGYPITNPKTKLTYGTVGDKWPTNYKLLKPAYGPGSLTEEP